MHNDTCYTLEYTPIKWLNLPCLVLIRILNDYHAKRRRNLENDEPHLALEQLLNYA